MAIVNNAMIIRRDLLTRMAELFKEQKLVDEIDRIPLEIAPRHKKSDRCCIHKERAVAKYKIMALMGFDLADEEDELTPLSEYAQMVLDREQPIKKILSVVDEACTSCVQAKYVITNLCKGCVARPCKMNCPKDAIFYDSQGKAHIDPESCVNCGLCQKVCPFHSVIYLPVPCEEACPVNAIAKDQFGIEQIDREKCILCGKCVTACPFGSVIENSQLFYVMKALQKGKKISAILAPSIFGQFNAYPGDVFDAIKELGFTHVDEVAKGANMTTAHEADELLEKLKEGQPFMTTSCCPSYVETVKRHIPEIQPYVSNTPSPMAYSAKLSKERDPEELVVFIGPCIAKRREGMNNKDVDYVLTFEELSCLLNGWEIGIKQKSEYNFDESILNHGRGFAASGGVAASVVKVKPDADIKVHLVNGLDKKQIKLLKAFAKKKKAPANFIEVMACEGGCLSGPSANMAPDKAKRIFDKEVKKFD